jgi:diguanylate cyclase (GGDEF)-like protein
VVLFDLDHFKAVNDALGHATGDTVLKGFAELLEEGAKGLDCVSRIGGEEFAVFAWLTDKQAVAFAEFIRQETARANLAQDVEITVSAGISTVYTPTDAEELLRQADLAVYFAKQQGRNRVASAGDIDSELSESDTDARVWEYETRVRVLAERFAEQISRLGRKALTEFRTEADHDGLTEVYNRRYFDRRLSREIERALSNGTSLSLIMLDLDDFGAVNRTYGFPGGDSALRVFGTIVHKNIRTVDWAARYGGEEFCIVMPDTRVEDGVRVAHRLRDALKATHATAVDGREIKMTASIGVVQLDAATDPQLADPVRLVQAASDRVREAKNAGKDRVCS